MTANELNLLIDILERRGEDRQLEAATMLRQQQAEIESLKKELALQRLSDIGQSIERELTDEEIINIIERLTAHWTYSFKNYEYNSDVPEQNKIRDDVFAILKKASRK